MDPKLPARILVTVLFALAFLLSLGAGLSAVVKWRKHREAQETYDEQRVRAAEFMERQSEKHMAFLQSPDPKDYDEFSRSQAAEANAAGFTPKTMGEFDLDNFVGERPSDRYQAPREVWVGVVALALATTASIVATWAL